MAMSVSVLLHGDVVNGGGILDSSDLPKIVYPGSLSISTTNSKFGGASIYSPAGAPGVIQNARGSTFWTDNWTTEFWIAPGIASQSPAAIFGNRNGNGGQFYSVYSGGQLTQLAFEVRGPSRLLKYWSAKPTSPPA
jgi:hypothetical protein